MARKRMKRMRRMRIILSKRLSCCPKRNRLSILTCR
jgi:hypothetical protein